MDMNENWSPKRRPLPIVIDVGVGTIVQNSNRLRQPTSNSIVGYRDEIGWPQCLHFPLRMLQDRTGILSLAEIIVRHFGHRERGETTDWS